MPFSVSIHPPKTPVTSGNRTVAKNTIPNVCKMPGPPAPFVPAPLPNIGKSELSPKDFSKTVKIEGHAVAIRGATFESIGDMASKGTGGGLISANTHGPTKFITPGSMTVKIEGNNVHLLAEPMLNNCGPSGSPPNTGATMAGNRHDEGDDAKCPPHDIEFSELTEEAEKKRRQEQQQQIDNYKKREAEEQKLFDYHSTTGTTKAQYVRGSFSGRAPTVFNNLTPVDLMEMLIETQESRKQAEFEQQVAKKYPWSGIKYKCKKNCGLDGEIDAVTPNGIIKEAKENGKIEKGQLKNLMVAGPALCEKLGMRFGGIHYAVPQGRASAFHNSSRGLGASDNLRLHEHYGVQHH